jgi:hypothetical protein
VTDLLIPLFSQYDHKHAQNSHLPTDSQVCTLRGRADARSRGHIKVGDCVAPEVRYKKDLNVKNKRALLRL